MFALLGVLRALFSVDMFCGKGSFKLFKSLFGSNDDGKEVEEACELLFEETFEDVDLLMALINEILSTGALFLDHDLDPEVGCKLLEHSDAVDDVVADGLLDLFSDSPSRTRSLLPGWSLTLLNNHFEEV